jgi:uncharacterized protein
MRKKLQFLQHYYIAIAASLIILGWAMASSNVAGVISILILTVTEITFSFENAVINSQVLATMNKFWRAIFLTVGIAVAVFGVRILLPLVLVSSATGGTLGHVLDLALHSPEQYSQELHYAYPVIAAFGGVFLLMIGLRFLGEEKEEYWLRRLELPLQHKQAVWRLPLAGAALATIALATILKPGDTKVVIAALLGAGTFIIIKLISTLLEHRNPESHGTGRKELHGFMALTQFLYLEILDASFSFDGVIAAFAITRNVVFIAAGLGIGALYVRSMTIHLLKSGTLASYRYLLHGAHYAILVLAILLMASIKLHIPEPITGFAGLTLILAAFVSSVRYNRTHAA